MSRLPLMSAAVLAGLSGLVVPHAKADAPAPDTRQILVLPFSSPSGANEAWVGKAVQQDLLTDLTQGTTARVSAPARATAASDSDEALKAGRDAGASIVIYGQAQNTGKDVRLSGQVLDVSTAKVIGALKATGGSDDLFHLEDALAGQVLMALPKELLTGPTLQGVQNAAANAHGQAGQPSQTNTGSWPNGPYTAPTVNDNSIYGQSQPAPVAPTAPAPQPQYDSVTVDPPTPVYSAPAPVYVYPEYNYYPAPAFGYSGCAVVAPDFGLGFYISPGWDCGYGGLGYGGFGYGGYGGYGWHGHDHDGDFHGGGEGRYRGGVGQNHGGGFAGNYNPGGVGHAYGGGARQGVGSFPSGGLRSGGISGAGAGSHAFSGGITRSGGFGGPSRGGAFHGSSGFGGGAHVGGFSGGGAHIGGFGGGHAGGFSGGGHGGGFSGGGGHGGGGGGHR